MDLLRILAPYLSHNATFHAYPHYLRIHNHDTLLFPAII